jgi:aminopeptidase 2
MCFARGSSADIVEGSMNVTGKRELLPANVKPTHYDLTLEPDLEKFTYDGTVVIHLDVAEDTKSIFLHSLDIDIKSTVITAGDAEVTSDPHVSYDKDKQTTMVKFDKTIPAGSKAQLKHTFTGTLNDTMAGFYRSSYPGPNGEKKYIASTQMEPTDARRAFPCFDEPALKATFTVTLIADKGLTCLGNMDVASEKEVDSKMSGGKKKAVTFNKSPLMSTYLVAFIVGDLKVIESSDFRCPIRVYATPDQDINQGKFALETAAKTLAFYEKAFDNEFPLPKMDMVAVPDFSAGAMENWGLITYRVVDLLFDEKISGASTKERVAEVVQHELAHQWFGNLVTMDWWDGLWLNEGFATWMSWYSCNEFYPEWKVWESYVIDNLQAALSLDSLRSSHPIEVPVKKADEINQIFDAISYSKGSVVLRMISKYLGEDTFIEGVRRYIHKHAYGNTQTGDLWAALSDASGKPVEEVMGIWTKEIGYPVITVDEDESSKSIKLTQNRFLRTGDVTPEEDKTIFPVFLGLRTKDGIDEQLTLSSRSESFKVPDMDFFKLNANHSGMYRTSYSSSRLEKLGKAAKKGLLSVEDRAGMIADAGALASSGYQKTSGILSLVKSFDSESEFVVWNEIISRIATIRAAWVFEDQKIKDALKAFQGALASKKAHELGWKFTEGEDHILQQFKALLFGVAGVSGDAKIVKAAQDMFARHLAGDKSAIHPNLRGGVYNMVLQNGGDKEYDGVLAIALNGATADERNTALRSLGRSKAPHLIQKTLELCLNGQVKAQDIYMPLAGLRAHTEGIEARWAWMTDNWEALVKKLPPGLNMLSSVVQICAGAFTTQEQMGKVQEFFKEKDTKVCLWDV